MSGCPWPTMLSPKRTNTHGTLGPLAAHFLDVRQIVDADAQQLGGRVGNHRQRTSTSLSRKSGFMTAEALERRQRAGGQRLAQAARP